MLSAAKNLHAELVAPVLGEAVGASTDEVANLERRLEVTLPAAYSEYLLWMGRDFNGIFRGSNWFASNVESNREVLIGLLEELGSRYEVLRSHVVFFTHQGYMAAWFDAAESGPDPKCLFINDGMKEPEVSGTFTEVLLADLRGLSSCIPR